MRYVVDSHSRTGVQHAVELEHYNGNGSCTCENFSFALERHLRGGAKPCDKLRCRHIKEARAQLVDDIIAATVKSRKKKRA